MTIGRSTGLPRLYEDDVRLATFSQLLCPRSPSGTAIQHGPAASERALQALCKEILGNGLLQQQQQQQSDSPAQHVSEIRAVRATAWKLLLGVDQLQPEVYLDLVQLGSSVANDKIRNDTFRTLATDTAFLNRVREDMLVRLLDAYVWRSSPDGQAIGSSYVQGMNVLAAPFLYAMPSELEAFACFSRFLEVHCPLYVQKTMEGVHRGLKLLDLCLQRIDVELYEYMKSKGLQAEVYAFPSILTFSACTPPLDQVLELWDFLLAFGVHLNVLCVVAQLYLIRDEIMTEISPVKMLRTLPPLDARATIALCCQFVKELPDELYDKLARHPWDTTLQM